MDTWRCFVAVDLPDDLRSDLAAAIATWRAEPDAPDVRWTDASAWHLTLAFLGAIPPSSVDRIAAALDRVAAGGRPMTFATGGLGAFPSRSRARVLWYGVADRDGALGAMADAVRDALVSLVPSLEHESPFRAHVTIARVRDQRGIDASGWLQSCRAPDGRLPLLALRLYRSHLGGQRPARYELIREVGLEREASVHG